MKTRLPVQLLIATPQGALPLDEQNAAVPLPQDSNSGSPQLRYGPFLQGIQGCLSRDGYRAILEALQARDKPPLTLADLDSLEIISEKHGALYHVVHVKVHVGAQTVHFGLNVAVSREQKAFLHSDFTILNELHEKFHRPHIPRVFLRDEAVYRDAAGVRRPLELFMTEWFEHHHEFHLSLKTPEEPPGIKVWDPDSPDPWLSEEETLALYRGAASILTDHLDTEDFRQIHPWHHAAGDFIVGREKGSVSVKLITARDYRCLHPHALSTGDMWIGIVCFFLNMTVRMRIDRLDGTGDLAWAGPSSLGGILEGFLLAWRGKHEKDPSLPSPHEVLEVLGGFNAEEWRDLGEITLEEGMVEREEIPFLSRHLPSHVGELRESILRAMGQ